MEDHEYPEWLWDVLKPKEKAGEEGVDADLYSKSKNKRAKAKKVMKERAAQEVSQKVPLYEQTIDLYAGDGSEAGNVEAARARQELTKAMREKRRATIKEANFLRTM
jgi:large subunit ribosomal protein L54